MIQVESILYLSKNDGNVEIPFDERNVNKVRSF